jgi:hypothetical protein
MPSINEELQDALIEHQINLTRVEQGQIRELNKTMNESLPELIGVLALWLDSARKGQQLTVLQERQFVQLERNLAKVRLPAMKNARTLYVSQLYWLIEHEIEFMDGLLRELTDSKLKYKIPNIDRLSERLTTKASYQGATVEQWFNNLAENDLKRMVVTIRAGVTSQLSDTDIIRSIRGSRALGFTDGTINTTANDTARMVRTITNGTVNDSRGAYAVSNKGLFKEERYTAVLDGKTSVICINLDGTIVTLGGQPRPPQHYYCRSFMVPILPENIGGASTMIKYPAWLKRQPAQKQNEVLGKTKAKMWRKGEVEIDQFVDSSGKILTIDQLKKLEG